jgi:hypothetical protein
MQILAELALHLASQSIALFVVFLGGKIKPTKISQQFSPPSLFLST